MNLYKFGHTSSILPAPIPSQDAIPLNGESHGVVGITRPGEKIEAQINALSDFVVIVFHVPINK